LLRCPDIIDIATLIDIWRGGAIDILALAPIFLANTINYRAKA
jgi:hypothetical protein